MQTCNAVTLFPLFVHGPAKMMSTLSQVHADCIVPNYQAVTKTYVRVKHLVDSEAPWHFPLVKMLGGNGFDMETAMGRNTIGLLNKFAAFTHAWMPLIRRWCDIPYKSCIPLT